MKNLTLMMFILMQTVSLAMANSEPLLVDCRDTKSTRIKIFKNEIGKFVATVKFKNLNAEVPLRLYRVSQHINDSGAYFSGATQYKGVISAVEITAVPFDAARNTNPYINFQIRPQTYDLSGENDFDFTVFLENCKVFNLKLDELSL